MTGISVPVFAFGGNVAAALTVPYRVLIESSQSTDLDRTRELLAEAREEISSRPGARPVTPP